MILISAMSRCIWENQKNVLVSDLPWIHSNPQFSITVAVDGSGCGIGAVLLYELPDGIQKTVRHEFRTLT